MKATCTLIVSLLLNISLYASPYQSRLTITSMSKFPVRIVVDGRTYSNRENSLNEVLIRDIRPGYHSIKVYQQRGNRYGSYHSGSFNSMRLVYESRILIRPDVHVDILVNRFGKVFIDEQSLRGSYYAYENNDDDQHEWDENNYRQAMDAGSFSLLKQTIRNEAFDATRLTIAKQAVSNQYFTAVQVKELVKLFSFEDSKLDLAKHCYSRTIDQHNYFTLNDVFNFSSSKEELAKFIQASK